MKSLSTVIVLILIVSICMLNSNQESMLVGGGYSTEATGTFSGVFLYEGEYYIVALKNLADKLPVPTRFFKSPILGDGVYQVARHPNHHANDRLITYVGNDFIAAPIRLRGGDVLDGDTLANIKNLMRKKFTGTWAYTNTESRDVPEWFFKPDAYWDTAQDNRLYDVVDKRMPYTNVKLS